MEIHKITNTNNSAKSLANINIDDKELNDDAICQKIEKQVKILVKKGKFLWDIMEIVNKNLDKEGLSQYSVSDARLYDFDKIEAVQKMSDIGTEISTGKLLHKFKTWDKYNGEHSYVIICKTNITYNVEDLIDFGTKEIPIENIERAYKDVEKLAKTGYVDREFVDKYQAWPSAFWSIIKNDNRIIPFTTFQKLKPEENNPEFIAKYLKDWKEEMLKVNRMGIQKYRYEKYGKTF